LSNSTGLLWPEVRAAIERIDLPIMKLDAGTETTFTAMNRPAAGIRFEDIVARLVAQKDIYIQTVLVGGHPANSGEEELAAYFDLLARIRPLEVHLHSIDRPVPDAGIALIPPERLEAIAAEGTCRTGVPIRAFYVGQRS
jgi:wyosine [tRNA(Phe)-imidazoG37] synthetase (radical SAM superfamily)